MIYTMLSKTLHSLAFTDCNTKQLPLSFSVSPSNPIVMCIICMRVCVPVCVCPSLSATSNSDTMRILLRDAK